MCLAVPGEIVSIDASDSVTRMGRVSFAGVVKEIALAMVPEAQLGQYVLVHAGVAISIVDEEEAEKIFEYLNAMESFTDAGPVEQ